GEGTVFKLDIAYGPNGTVGGDPQGPKLPVPYNHPPAKDLADFGDDKEAYRRHLLIRNNRAADDYSDIIAVSQALSLVGEALARRIGQVIDVDQWMRTFAVQSLTGPADTYSRSGLHHNISFYVRPSDGSPSDGRVLALPWDWDFAFTLSTSASLVGPVSNLNQVINIPANRRLFDGHLLDIINTTFNTDYMSRWTAHYGAVAGQNFSGIANYITARRAFVLGQLPAEIPFTITSNGGADFSVDEPFVTLEGEGWINVRKIRLEGQEQPLDVTWLDRSRWQVQLPIGFGETPIVLEAYDFAGEWLATQSIVVTSTAGQPRLTDVLRISEIHFNPIAVGDFTSSDLEFVELTNISDQPIDLTQARFSDGIDFDFAGSGVNSLAPGAYVVVVSDPVAFASRYDTDTINIAGSFDGKLSNGGERLRLVDQFNQPIQEITYRDGWHKLADGLGFSLTRVDAGDVSADPNDSTSWRPSSELHGSPGEGDSRSTPDPGHVVIDEVLAHSEDALGDWIELFNTTGADINIGGWFLSNDRLDPLKYEIPFGTMIPASGFATFTESQHFGEKFTLSESGDELIVQAASGGALLGFRAREDFGASEGGRTFGRFIKTTGGKDFVALENATFGDLNSPPLVGPVVIHEVMYNPGPGGGSEFVELLNISDEAVMLAGWHFSAITYTFDDVMIPPGELVVVVPLTPEEFRATHNVPAEARLFGPYFGGLSNAGESLRLNKPGKPEGEIIPSIMVDRVSYDDKLPWPVEADGTGVALQRITPDGYGNEPTNWTITLPGGTPGDFAVPPTVEGVFVSGSDWSPAVFDRLGASGFSIPAGADQLQTLAWTGVDRISIRFSEHVEVTSADLQVAGVNLHEYRTVDFQYDRPALTATWTLERPARADKLLVELSADVRDASGLPLDGNWANAISNFPSGNGAIDDDEAFQFRFNVVPGDVTGDGRVDRADLVDLIHHLGDSSTTPDSLRRDLTGDGRVDVLDLRAALLRQGAVLPTTEPERPGSATPQAAVDTVFARAGGASPGRLLLAVALGESIASDDSMRTQRQRIDSRPPSLGHLIDTIDRLGRRDHATLHRANRNNDLSASRHTPVRRLQAAAIDRAMAEQSTLDRPKIFRRRAGSRAGL
ncbi:MAG: lamin tail domain-containing protein, partial [Planctomycetes bacterium]|nr:lamin tail domain-containing protein [Planctomycetota bacterium]